MNLNKIIAEDIEINKETIHRLLEAIRVKIIAARGMFDTQYPKLYRLRKIPLLKWIYYKKRIEYIFKETIGFLFYLNEKGGKNGSWKDYKIGWLKNYGYEIR